MLNVVCWDCFFLMPVDIMRLLKCNDAHWLKSASRVPMVRSSEGQILFVLFNIEISKSLVHLSRGKPILKAKFEMLLITSSTLVLFCVRA